jgi:hypothetical protein
MSAASEPAPRYPRTGTAGSRHSLFWPMFVYLLGAGIFAGYQVMALEDQLDEVTRGIDQMDAKVVRAKYEKAKFYAIAGDIVRLSATDSNAEEVATHFKLHELQSAQPILMSTTTAPLAPIATRTSASGTDSSTNASPLTPVETPSSGPLPAPNAAP